MALTEKQQARLLAMLEKARQEADLREQAKQRHPSMRQPSRAK